MHQAIIYIDPVGPAPVGFAQAAGMPGDIRFDFKTQGNLAYPDVASLYPQLVLRPFTQPDVHAYDIVINDPTGASGIATVPGSRHERPLPRRSLSRGTSTGQPQRMLACRARGPERLRLHQFRAAWALPATRQALRALRGLRVRPAPRALPESPACADRAGTRAQGAPGGCSRTTGCRATCIWTRATATSGAGTAGRGAAFKGT